MSNKSFGLTHFSAQPWPRDANYKALLQQGHELRDAAGSFDAAIAKVTSKDGKLSPADFQEVEAAMVCELDGTGNEAALATDLQALVQEWGWKADDKLRAVLTERFPEVGFAELKDKPSDGTPSPLAINGLFYQAAEDALVEPHEVDAVVAAWQKDESTFVTGEGEAAQPNAAELNPRNAAYHANFARLRSAHGVKWEPQSVHNLRAKIQDEAWWATTELGRDLSKMLANGVDEDGARTLRDRVLEASPRATGRQKVIQVMQQALANIDVPNVQNHASLTPEAKVVFNGFLTGLGDLDEQIDQAISADTVTPAAANEIGLMSAWLAHSKAAAQTVPDQRQFIIQRLAEKMGSWYWEDPRVPEQAVHVLDRHLLGGQYPKHRQRLHSLDTIGMIQALANNDVPIKTVTQQNFGDPDEGDAFTIQGAQAGGFLNAVIIKGYSEDRATIQLTKANPIQVLVNGAAADPATAKEIVNDERLQSCIRSFLDLAMSRDVLDQLVKPTPPPVAE